MPRILVYQLCGSLASFSGEEAVGPYRPSGRFTLLSMVEGTLGASLGVRRDDPRALTLMDEFSVSCLQLTRSNQILDFHTVLTKGKGGAFISRRGYHCDVLIDAAVAAASAEADLESLAAALRSAAFCLYLGRKSAPLALPPNPQILESTGAAAALRKYYESWQLNNELLQPLLRTASRDDFSRYFALDDDSQSNLTAELYWRRSAPIDVQAEETWWVRDRCINRRSWVFEPSLIAHARVTLPAPQQGEH